MKAILSSFIPSVVVAFCCLLAPEAAAIDAAYVHILKNDTADTRFHLGEVEAYSGTTVPDDLGGGLFGELATSTNDIGDGTLTTFGDGNLYPVLGTTTTLEHGELNKDPNNLLETAGDVWSTANGLAEPSQYTLDLGGVHDVTTLRLWPRADGCCATRWQNLEIQLLDENLMPIPDTMRLHTPNEGNVALEFTYVSSAAEVEAIELGAAVTFPSPEDVVVLSSAANGTLVADLFALDEEGVVIPGAEFALVSGDGDTDNGLYRIGGPEESQLLVDSNLSGLVDVTHSVRLLGEAGSVLEEVFTWTVKADVDTDNLIDDWETMFGGLGDFSTGADADSDGLNDEDEFLQGTDPSKKDSDDDGSEDGDEITNMTDPNNPDTDEDGLNDGGEVTAMSDPLNPDTDGDTILDGEEVILGEDGYITSPILADTDGDTVSDPLEIASGTDPTDPNSKPSFPTARGRFIEVVKNDLADTRMHISEFEVFAPGATPTGEGGGNEGLSANDLIDVAPLTATRYLGAGTPTTTVDLEHGGGSSQTDNMIESNANVWSTANGLIEEARYVLDLGQSTNMDVVRIWARGDGCCTQRFQNLTINLYSDDGGNPGILISSVVFPDTGPFGGEGPLEIAFAAGAISLTPLAISSIETTTVDSQVSTISLTWNSTEGSTYAVKFSGDMTDWGNDVDDSIPSMGEETTFTFDNPSPAEPRLYFRVEDVTDL